MHGQSRRRASAPADFRLQAHGRFDQPLGSIALSTVEPGFGMAAAPSGEKRIGSTSLTWPQFGFGAAHLGELYAKVDEAESRATLDAAWDAGVRFYDTAPWYGRGLSEHRAVLGIANQ